MGESLRGLVLSVTLLASVDQVDQYFRRPLEARLSQVTGHCGEVGHTRPVCPIRKHKATSFCYVPRPEFVVPLEKQADSPLVTVQLNGLDTGCSQPLVQFQLVPREWVNEGETVPVICVHGHVSRPPQQRFTLKLKDRFTS